MGRSDSESEGDLPESMEEEEKLDGEGQEPCSSQSGGEKDVKKSSKAGIIYLSIIPPKMNVTQIREYFSQYGEIHRSFLQPDKVDKRKGRKNQTFTEGWIEYKKRRHAKKAAALLNNTPLGGKKKKQTYDFLWNVKYLPGLQWVHINERLAYERISRQQKMRAEISAAKRETSFFAKSVSLNKKLKRNKNAYQDRSSDETISKNGAQESSSSEQKPFKQPQKEAPKSRLKLFQAFFPAESSTND